MTTDAKNIFLVDDDPGLLDLLGHLLRKKFSGISINSISDGSKVNELLGERLPEVIVTDVLMPGMSGVELMYMLKSDKRLSKIKVIAMTGLEEDDPRIDAVKTSGLFRIVFKETAFTENLLQAVEDAFTSEGADANYHVSSKNGIELYEGTDEDVEDEFPVIHYGKKDAMVFNYERILESMDGDFEMLRIAVKTFLATCDFVMEQLEEGVQKDDAASAARAAHTMAGAAGSIGGERLKNICSETEASLLKNGGEASRTLISTLKSEYEDLIRAIKKAI